MVRPKAVRVAVLTVSDTRSKDDDVGGATAQEHLEAMGFDVACRSIVRDEPSELRAEIGRIGSLDLADAIVMTGGTGIAPRDQTVETLEAMMDKRLDGFGEAFRRLSWDEIGPRAVLSRAVAGVVGGRFVAALPGSPSAVRLAVTELLGPILEHAISLVRGRSQESLGHRCWKPRRRARRSPGMMTLDEALAMLMVDVPIMTSECVALGLSVGRVVARDVPAPVALPRFDYSAMDGYAVRTTDVEGPGPWTLPVKGESRPGGPRASWLPGTAQRISTGAALPDGTDAVIVQEAVGLRDGGIVFDACPKVGQNVRRKGEDVERGAVALRRGERIAPSTLALAAMMGLPEMIVARRPRFLYSAPATRFRVVPRTGTHTAYLTR